MEKQQEQQDILEAKEEWQTQTYEEYMATRATTPAPPPPPPPPPPPLPAKPPRMLEQVVIDSDPKASFRCIARHLSTLSRLVWGNRSERRGSNSTAADVPALPKIGSQTWWVPSGPAAAYLSELGSIGGGAGVDPLVDLLLLHPPLPLGTTTNFRRAGGGAAWLNANAEARQIVQRLMVARGERLATLESRPPTAQWVVLAFTGSSLILAFAFVSISTRPATNVASRLLFTGLSGALLSVFRLLLDLSEPFDGGSYTLATENTAGAILAPTRRRLVAALTTRLNPKKTLKKSEPRQLVMATAEAED